MTSNFIKLVDEMKACRVCDDLPLGPRPVFQLHPSAPILVAAQAPGTKVHTTGLPFNDPSGDRLREWMGIDRETFYDPKKLAIFPMGLCYPGRGKSGDLPPRLECATHWRQRVIDQLSNLQLILVIGQYAHAWHLPARKATLTETVQSWKEYGPLLIPLPHPSPRNNIWLKKNAWFEEEVVPVIRRKVKKALKKG